MARPRLLALVMFAATACGGPRTASPEPIGTTHATPPDAAPAVAQPGEPGGAASQPGGATSQPGGAEAPTLGFELKNAAKSELAFAIDKGWQPVIFAYSGKPPKAKAALLFPAACTGPCDGPPEEACPVCKKEADPIKAKKAEQAETKREVAPPGQSVKVPWDGKVLVYEKAGGKKRCKCWRKADPEPGRYTIKACGLLKATKPGKPAKLTCGETEVELPLAAPGLVAIPIGATAK